ncbi:MAG: threonylcarbamoyl-AMP synthase [Robiginitomaculum sp.]|nr:threonylcarbamoyl-AMP synthase [Robiginitomaculum sp.]
MLTTCLSAKNASTLGKAASILSNGGLVIVPTETVYGIAALASDGIAIERIYQIKGRPDHKALLAHIDGLEMAKKLAMLNPLAEKLIASFWPGPLTLVLPKLTSANIHENAGGGLPSIAVRCPDHDFTKNLIAKLNQPLVAPSANFSGEPPPASLGELSEQIANNVDLIVDGGTCISGQPSTLIDLTGASPKILRQGALSRQQIEQVSGSLG